MSDLIEQLTAIASDETEPPSRRATAAMWAVGAPESEPDAAWALIDQEAVGVERRCRLAAALALSLLDRDDPAAARAIECVETLAAESATPLALASAARVRLLVALNGTDVERIRGEMSAVETATEEVPPWASGSLRAVRVRSCLRLLQLGETVQPLAALLLDDIEAATVGTAPPHARNAALLLDSGSLALAVGEREAARQLAERALACAGESAPAEFVFAAQLGAADARWACDGPEAALEIQREAVKTAERLGQPHPIGWATRGAAMQLRQLGRSEEAIVAFESAAASLEQAGDEIQAWTLRIDQGRLCLSTGAANEALRLGTAVVVAIDERTELEPLDTEHQAFLPLCAALELCAMAEDGNAAFRSAARLWLRACDEAQAIGSASAGFRSAAARSFAWAGDQQRAESEFAVALADADLPWLRGLVRHRRAEWRASLEARADATEDARQAVDAFEEAADEAAAARAGLLLAELTWQSDPETAVRALQRAQQHADRTDKELAEHVRAMLAQAPAQLDAEATPAPGSEDDAAALHGYLTDAHATSTSMDELVRLARHPAAEVRRAVAERSSLPRGTWKRLSRDPSEDVILAVARNPNASGRALRRLGGRRRPTAVLLAVAANPRSGWLLKYRLVRSERWDVRAAVVTNPRCGWFHYACVSRDKVWTVRAAVAASPRAPRIALRPQRGAVPAVRFALAGNPHLPTPYVNLLLRDHDQYVRSRAASNPSVDGQTLRLALGEMNAPAWVLRMAAANPACPESLREELLTWISLGGAEGDPRFDPVACDGAPPGPEVDAWQWYLNESRRTSQPWAHPLWRVRQVTTRATERVPYDYLHRLARDPVADVRRTTLTFPGMNLAIYKELTRDPDPGIRAAALPVYERERKAKTWRDRIGLRPAPRLGTSDTHSRAVGVATAALVAAIAVAGSLSSGTEQDRQIPDIASLLDQLPPGAVTVPPATVPRRVLPVTTTHLGDHLTVIVGPMTSSTGSFNGPLGIEFIAHGREVVVHQLTETLTTGAAMTPVPSDLALMPRELRVVALPVAPRVEFIEFDLVVAGEATQRVHIDVPEDS